MTCVVCQQMNGAEMTDGRTRHAVCDVCREFVNVLFFVYGSLNTAVREAAQAKRGTTEGV